MNKDSFCTDCNIPKVVDSIKYQYVCQQCGVVSNNNSYRISNAFASWDFRPIFIQPYDRCKSFNKVIVRNKYISSDLIKPMNKMFRKLQKPYYEIVNLHKKFFMNDYVIIKFLHMLDRPDLVEYFKLPVTKQTRDKYENIWEQICEKINLDLKEILHQI